MSSLDGIRNGVVDFWCEKREGWGNLGLFAKTLLLTAAVFDPQDPWARVFRRALARSGRQFGRKVVVELGVGSGASTIQILFTSAPRKMVINDLVPDCVTLAVHNINTVCDVRLGSALLRTEEGDAVDCLRRLAAWGSDRPDWIVGCLPQVPAASADDLRDLAMVAHEYDRSAHPDFAHWGLGLIADVKVAAREALAPGGKMLLVHSGRVPARVRQEMDATVGFRETHIVDQEVVLHHAGTPLNYLFGERGELLFGDPHGREVITPEEAEERRCAFVEGRISKQDYHVYHWVHVVESERAA